MAFEPGTIQKTQWRFPISLIDPMIWYWTHLGFYEEPETLEGTHARGVSWLELAMDFEISTRVPLSRSGPGNANEDMRQRAALMSDVSKAVLRGLGTRLNNLTIHCRATQVFRSPPRAGLKYRPALLQPESVGLELCMQVMIHPALMGQESTQWKLKPMMRLLPPPLYSPVFLNERLWRRRPTRLKVKTRFIP